ncbi:MAG: NAD(+)/NADH kinase, partial [Acidimicrobiia bacterium]
MKEIGLVVSTSPEAQSYAEEFIAAAEEVGLTARPIDQGGPVDIVLAIGGDGTVLEAAHAAVARDVPIMGVNLGTIGFLAEAEPDELDETIAALVEGSFRIESRNTIEVSLPDGTRGLGVNDVV